MATVDAEAVVATWLAERITARVVVELPADVETRLPVVQVTGLPGPKTHVPWSDPRPLLWSPRVDLDCYARDRAEATDLAGEVSAALFTLRGKPTPWGFVARVAEPSGPSWRPDYNTAVRRVGLTAELTIRAA